MNMQNDTFNQILNSNLASMDPGFGQFALAKASSDLFKKVINKYGAKTYSVSFQKKRCRTRFRGNNGAAPFFFSTPAF